MSIRFFIIAAVSAFLAACSCGGDDSKNVDFSKINTFVVSDSSGYEVGKGRAYAVINIAEPSGLSKLCKKNYAMWVSTVLQVDPTDDKNAVQSLATAFAQKEALRWYSSTSSSAAASAAPAAVCVRPAPRWSSAWGRRRPPSCSPKDSTHC